MADILIRKEGRAGRVTLTRPKAMNALTHQMCLDCEAALDAWRDDPEVMLVILDAEGERAFCAGGDIAQVHAAGVRGDFHVGRDFWRDEYRLNAKLAGYPKPIISLMQGFVMGGGVGWGCHVSHRVVGETTQLAMPECGIGLIPDVGGTYLLARAPGRLGLHLGLTGARIDAGDAVHAGFADHFIPETEWPGLVDDLVASGDSTLVPARARPAPQSRLAADQPAIDAALTPAASGSANGAERVAKLIDGLTEEAGEWTAPALKALARNSPLSMACTVELIAAIGPADNIRTALHNEFRWTWRSMDMGDFLEGVRAQIIDKDRNPRWRHDSVRDVTAAEIEAMLAPLGADELTFEEDEA